MSSSLTADGVKTPMSVNIKLINAGGLCTKRQSGRVQRGHEAVSADTHRHTPEGMEGLEGLEREAFEEPPFVMTGAYACSCNQGNSRDSGTASGSGRRSRVVAVNKRRTHV